MTDIQLSPGVTIILPDEIKNVTPETAETVMEAAIANRQFIEPFFQELESLYAPGSIKINGARDQEGYDKAKQAAKTLQKIRTATGKICKSQRDEWVRLSKESNAFENSLVDRIVVMEEAIKSEIAAVDEVIAKERLEEDATAKLPFRTQILTDAGVVVTEEVTAAFKYLNDVEFQTYYNDQRTIILNAKQEQIESEKKKHEEEERKQQIEKEAMDNARKEIRIKTLEAIGMKQVPSFILPNLTMDEGIAFSFSIEGFGPIKMQYDTRMFKDMDDESFNQSVDSLKEQISDLKKRADNVGIRQKTLEVMGFTEIKDQNVMVFSGEDPEETIKFDRESLATMSDDEFTKFCSESTTKIAVIKDRIEQKKLKEKDDLHERKRRTDILLAMKFAINSDFTAYTQNIGDIHFNLTTEYIFSLTEQEFNDLQVKTANQIIDANSILVAAEKRKAGEDAIKKKKDDEAEENAKKERDAQEEARKKALLPDKEKLEKFNAAFEAFIVTCPEYPILQTPAAQEILKYFDDCQGLLKKKMAERISKL